MEIGQVVEHRIKKKPTDNGLYRIVDFCKMKNPTTREWVDCVVYRDIRSYETYVREKIDFEYKFKLFKHESKD